MFDHNALDTRGKIFCVTPYLKTKSLKTVPKLLQPINTMMIYYWEKNAYPGSWYNSN